jgi:spermidine/putrescine transport system permease protein
MTGSKGINRLISSLFLFVFYCFLYAPIVILIVNSIELKLSPFSVDFIWYKKIFERSDIIGSMINSFILAIMSVVFSLFISMLGISHLYFRGRKEILIFFSYAGIVLPEIALAIAILLFFVNFTIGTGMISLLVAHTIVGIGYTFPILYQRWISIDKNIIDASYDLGSSSTLVWKTVLIPLFKKNMISAGIIVFILSFDDYLLAYFCGSPEFITFSMAILSILRVGLSPEIQAVAVFVLFMSVCIGVFYAMYSFASNNRYNRKIENE